MSAIISGGTSTSLPIMHHLVGKGMMISKAKKSCFFHCKTMYCHILNLPKTKASNYQAKIKVILSEASLLRTAENNNAIGIYKHNDVSLCFRFYNLM